MPRQRNRENMGLPKGWTRQGRLIFYRVPKGQSHKWDGKKDKFLLGTSEAEAYKVWSERIGYTPDADIMTIEQLLDRYEIQVVSKKRPQTQKGYRRAIKELKIGMGKMLIFDVEPQDVYKYMDERGFTVAARREKSVLSGAFTNAVMWGLLKRHPFKHEIELEGETPRTRYVEDWEIAEIMGLQKRRKKGDLTPMFQAYIRLKMLTGLRQANMLQINVKDLTDEGIRVDLVKKRVKKVVIFKWTPELRAAVDAALEARPLHIAPWLFCTRRGACYYDPARGEATGFKSSWYRFETRVMAETKITEHFTEHDIRGKAGSDAETVEEAQKLLTHEKASTTRQHYRRRPERISPLK